MNSFEEFMAKYHPEYYKFDYEWEDMKAAYAAGMERAAKIAEELDVNASNADSNGCLTNNQDRWTMGVFDASEQIAAAIREEIK